MTADERPPERDVEDMQEQSDRLGDEIEDVRDKWDRRKRDPQVPGAAGDPDRAEEEPPPEQQYPAKGD